MSRNKKRRTYGSGSLVQRGPAKWTIHFREKDGRRKTKTLPTRDLAERVLRAALGDIARDKAGLPADPRRAQVLSELFTPWLAGREAMNARDPNKNRSWRDDRSRWNAHVGPFFGRLRPGEVTGHTINAFVEEKLRAGLKSTSVGHCVRLLSTFFSDLVEDETNGITVNPVKVLKKSIRAKYRNAKVEIPFLKTEDDIRRVFLALPEPYSVMFATGAMCGLRTGEVIGLEWEHVDIERRRIRVVQQVNDGRIAPLKDGDPRTVPIQDSLMATLKAWKLKTGGVGLMFRPTVPTRGGRPDLAGKHGSRFIRPNTLHARLKKALEQCPGVPSMTWYAATRHTFASQYVLGGGKIEELRKVLGHESVTTTQRYEHHEVDHFAEAQYSRVRVDFSPPSDRRVLPIRAPIVSKLSDGTDDGAAEKQLTRSNHK